MRHPLVAIVASRLGSFGDTGTSESQVALARNAAFGDPAFEDCFVEVPNRSLTTGVDGRPWRRRLWRFRIGVDASARVLQLTPFDDPAALLDGSHRSIPVVGIYNLLAVKARVEAAKRGSSF